MPSLVLIELVQLIYVQEHINSSTLGLGLARQKGEIVSVIRVSPL